MSIVIVKFPAAPKPTFESLKREADLDMEIERRIKGSMNFSYYSHILLSFCCCINSRTRTRKKY